MITIGNQTFTDSKAAAHYIATQPNLQTLRIEILRAIIQHAEKPMIYHHQWLRSELRRIGLDLDK